MLPCRCPACGSSLRAENPDRLATCPACLRLFFPEEPTPSGREDALAGAPRPARNLAIAAAGAGLLLVGVVAVLLAASGRDTAPAPLFGPPTDVVVSAVGWLVAILAAHVFCLVLLIGDVRRRAPDQTTLWVILFLLTGLVGVLLWLAVRPPLPE